MGKSFFKPKFRIRRSFVGRGIDKIDESGYLVEVKYWWFPVWVTATVNIIDGGKLTTAFAVFNNNEMAVDYIKRRYTVYTFDNLPQIIDEDGKDEIGED